MTQPLPFEIQGKHTSRTNLKTQLDKQISVVCIVNSHGLNLHRCTLRFLNKVLFKQVHYEQVLKGYN